MFKVVVVPAYCSLLTAHCLLFFYRLFINPNSLLCDDIPVVFFSEHFTNPFSRELRHVGLEAVHEVQSKVIDIPTFELPVGGKPDLLGFADYRAIEFSSGP